MDCYVANVTKVEDKLAHLVASLLRACAANPKRTVAAFLTVTLALIGCFLGLVVTETEGTKLWVDQNSIPMQDLKFVQASFEAQPRLCRFTVVPKTGKNILTQQAFQDAFDIHTELLAQKTPNGFGLKDLCQKDFFGECNLGGPLRFWNFNATQFATLVKSDEDVQQTCANPLYPDFSPVQRVDDFAGFSINEGTGLASASAIQMVYPLLGELKDGSNTEQLEFELVFRDVGFVERKSVEVYVEVTRALDDELASTLGNDIQLMIIAFTAMIMFASTTLGKPGSPLHGRVLLANAEVYVIMLSTGAAFGLATLFQVPFTAMAQILPFILLGIGIDNAYVLSAAFDRAPQHLSIEDRMYYAGTHAGMSVTVTSLTNFCAFMFTSISKLPSIAWFGLYASTAIIFIYIAHVTVFPALLALDTQRVQARRRDCTPCCTVKGAQETQVGVVNPDDKDDEVAESSDPNSSKLSIFFRDYYGAFIVKRPVAFAIVLSFAAACGLLIWRGTSVGTQFELRDLTPDESYLRDALNIREELWGNTIGGFIPTALYFRNLNFETAAVQAEIRRLSEAVLEVESISKTIGKIDWHAAFSAWAVEQPKYNSSLSEDGRFVIGNAFFPAVVEFVGLQQFQTFRSDLVLGEDKVKACRIWYFHEPIEDSNDSVDALLAVQQVTADSPLEPKPFLSSFIYLFWDQFRIILRETIVSVSLAIVAVTAVSSILLVHPGQVVIMVIVLTMIFSCLVGLVEVWGLQLNSISSINLILSIGLTIDYTLHIAHSFGMQRPELSRQERVRQALHDMGPSVFLGVSTSFLGVVPLAWASSEAFRVFFQLMFSIVVVGGLHGLVFLPAVLSFVGPSILRPDTHVAHHDNLYK